MSEHLLEHSNQTLYNVHASDQCLGEYCTIHNMSDHSMRSFPQYWREDRGFMERICPHGVGHPDPDEGRLYGKWDRQHGCDGCCDGSQKDNETVMYLTGMRPDWDDYYLGIAKAVSARGDCVRAQHGAVIVKNHKIVSTGYNGTPPGDCRSCGTSGECPRALDLTAQHSKGEYDLCWATHAEANAIIRASWDDLNGSTIYVTGTPCPGCTKLIYSSNIVRVVTA